MLRPLRKNFKGLITISGPSNCGKSQLAEFLIKEQESITYIATSKPRANDLEWERRIDIHRKRRPESWSLIEHPQDICNTIRSISCDDSILIDSLGGLVEQNLMKTDDEWQLFQNRFLNCLIKNEYGIILVTEEIGWGIVPATPIGHLFRERHTTISTFLSTHSMKKWLAVNGTAIDLDKFGFVIPT